MTDFVFDDFARTTLGGATNVADGKPLTQQQLERVIAYLKSPGSGPDGVTSYAEYVSRNMATHPPKLPAGVDYIGYSGTDASNTSNWRNADQYVRDTHGKANMIGETPWGKFIETAPRNPEFAAITGKFESFMQKQGLTPFGDNFAGALKDMMWNAGSPEFFENAIASRRPIVAFVDGAPNGRGFSNFELTTALKHPEAIINGYPVSAFTGDPLEFARKSAAEFQQLERTIAQAATVTSGKPVTVEQVRADLKLIDGYDAVKKTLFNQPIDAFKSLTLEEMSTTRASWLASRVGLTPRPNIVLDAPERLPGTAAEPGAPRAPPAAVEPSIRPAAIASAEAAAEAALPKGLSPSGNLMLKGAGAAGIALLAYDFATTGHKVFELRAQGNNTGAESAKTHFIGRTAGGIGAGFLAGAGYGLIAGSETGPGALVTGLIGGVIGAYAGEKWAEQRDNDKIFKQTDSGGVEWSRDPQDPNSQWARRAQTQQLDVAPGAAGAQPGQDVKVTPKPNAPGSPAYVGQTYVAVGTLARQLNYQSANASYELGLANPPDPRNPYSIAGAQDKPGWHAGNWNRDATTGEWSRVLVEQTYNFAPVLLPVIPPMETQKATPQQAAALEAQSQIIVAQNAANTPAALAARYEVAYNQFGWDRVGQIPAAITNAANNVNTLKASDGNTYTRGADGQWISSGMVWDSKAEGNILRELNAVYQSQQVGIGDLRAIAQYAKEHPQPEPNQLRDMIGSVYRSAGIARTEAQLDAAATAVARDHQQDGLGNRSYSLKLLPDPKTGAIDANSSIATMATDDKGKMVMKSVTTPLEIQSPPVQPTSVQPTSVQPTTTQPTAPGSPLQRMGALDSPSGSTGEPTSLALKTRNGIPFTLTSIDENRTLAASANGEVRRELPMDIRKAEALNGTDMYATLFRGVEPAASERTNVVPTRDRQMDQPRQSV